MQLYTHKRTPTKQYTASPARFERKIMKRHTVSLRQLSPLFECSYAQILDGHCLAISLHCALHNRVVRHSAQLLGNN